MMTLLLKAAARATATAWRWPPERLSTAWPMFCRVPMPSELIWSFACLRIPAPSSIRSTEPSGPALRSSRPRNMFPAMSSEGATAKVW